MSPSVFISYSRREAPFVDALLGDLENNGVQVWVDYQKLIPGQPWLKQIIGGIDAMESFLLVVSRSAMESKNVEVEYKHALEDKKRVILAVFEAAPLPPALADCEWVDFRDSFDGKYHTLLELFAAPDKPSAPVPRSGYKAPTIVWLAFALSVVSLLISIPGWWTLYLPLLVVPLPYQILKRNYSFYRARFAFLTLPVALFLSWVFAPPYLFDFVPFVPCLLASLLLLPLWMALLNSKGLRVWGMPGASEPQFANIHEPGDAAPQPLTFAIEHAPEDEQYAAALADALTQVGHGAAQPGAEAQVNFVLISAYKNHTALDVESQVVYPVIVQDTTFQTRALQRLQWIDYRRGMKNLNHLAQLLPQPAKLMKALGVPPIGGLGIYPRIVQMCDYFLTLLAFFSLGIWIPLSLEFGWDFLQFNKLTGMEVVRFVGINIVFTGTILNTVFAARRGLISRKGHYAALGRIVRALLWVGFVGFTQTLYLINIIITETGATQAMLEANPRGAAVLFQPLGFTLGFVLLLFFGARNWEDLKRWFPVRSESGAA